MEAQDIVIGEYYAVSMSYDDARRVKVLSSAGKEMFRVRFLTPVSVDWDYFYSDKAGSREHDLSIDCFDSTWAEHKEEEGRQRRVREQFTESVQDLQRLLTDLETAVKSRGFSSGDLSSGTDTEWDWEDENEKEIPVATLTVTRDLLLHLVEAVERMDAPGGDVVAGLLGEGQ